MKKLHDFQRKNNSFTFNFPLVACIILMGLFMANDFLYGQRLNYTHYSSGSSIVDLAIHGDDIWVVNRFGGIVKVQRTTGDMIHFNHTDPNLRSNNMTSLAMGPDGALWAGGYAGLFKYDGVGWKDYGEVDALFGDVSGIEKVVVDPDNVVWMSHFAGLVRFDGSSPPQIFNSSNSPLSTTLITDIAVDVDGSIWVGMAFGGGLMHLKDGNWNLYTAENSGLFSNRVNHITIDQDGVKWIGTNGSPVGLTRFDGVNWQTYNRLNSGLSAFEINALAFDDMGGIWIGTDNELQYFDGDQWENYSLNNSPLTGRNINALQILPDGELWIGVRHSIEDEENQNIFGVKALLRKNGSDWESFETGNSPLPNSWVTQIEFNSQGNAWISTYGGGIAYLENGEWQQFDAGNSLLESSYIEDILLNGDDELWIALGFSNLMRKMGDNWEVFTPENSGFPSYDATTLARGADGSVWIGTGDNKLVRYHSDTWTVYDSENSPLENQSIYKIFVDSKGGVWVMGSYDYLAYLLDDVWTIYNSSTTEWPGLFMYCLEEDHLGRVWLGTDMGVFRYDENQWEHFTELTSGLSGREIFNMERDGDNMWINSNAGLLKYYQDDRWVKYSGALEGRSITDDNSLVLKAGPNGDLWAGSITGLNIITELPSIAVSATQITFDSTAVGDCKQESYSVEGFKVKNDLVLTSSLADFQLSLDPDQGFTQELVLPGNQPDYTKIVYLQFCPQQAGVVSAEVEHRLDDEPLASLAASGLGYILTSAYEEAQTLEISIFPNPVDNYLNYEFSHSISGKGTMYIYNLSGQSMGTYPINSASGRIDLGQLNPGVYSIHIEMENESALYIQKLIKLE